MTRGDVYARLLAEASGKPVDEAQGMLAIFGSMFFGRVRFSEEISEEEAESLLETLRKEIPMIRRLLLR